MDTKTLLASGLQAGFARSTGIESVDRGGFSLKASHVESSNGGGVYHDEWVDGGGQELVRTEAGEAFSRG